MVEIQKESETKKLNWGKILEQRLRIVEDSRSIVIAPRTREGHILTRLAFGLDRAVSRIRVRAGTFISIQDTVVSLKKVDDFINDFKEFVNAFGDGVGLRAPLFDSPEVKKSLASLRSSHVILPRSNEGREVAYLIKQLDPALIQFRNTCTDFSKSEGLFKKLVEIIRRFHLLLQELFSILEIPYESPKNLSSLLKTVGEEKVQEISEKQVSGEASLKGRKAGGIA